MGGGRVAPNPSNEVDVYDPGTNTWSTGSAVQQLRGATSRPTLTARRSIWLSGGYDVDWRHTAGVDGNLLPRRRNANANTNGNGYSYCDGNSDGTDCNCNSNGDCDRDGHRHSISNGDTTTDANSSLRQHRGLGQHQRLVHSACSRFAAAASREAAKRKRRL